MSLKSLDNVATKVVLYSFCILIIKVLEINYPSSKQKHDENDAQISLNSMGNDETLDYQSLPLKIKHFKWITYITNGNS